MFLHFLQTFIQITTWGGGNSPVLPSEGSTEHAPSTETHRSSLPPASGPQSHCVVHSHPQQNQAPAGQARLSVLLTAASIALTIVPGTQQELKIFFSNELLATLI